MKSLKDKSAVVIGASSGVGLATVKRLVFEGASVVAVARGRDGLDAVAAAFDGAVQTVQADATDATTAERLLREYEPQLVVLAAGVRPQMGTLDEFTWEAFSIPWNADAQAAFHLLKAALTVPLAAGSTVAICFERSRGRRLTALGRLRRCKAHAMVYDRVRTRSVGREEVRHPFFRRIAASVNRRHGDRNHCSRQLRRGARLIGGGVSQAPLEGAARRR